MCIRFNICFARDRTLDVSNSFSRRNVISFFPFSLSRYSKINNSVVTWTKNWTHEKKKKRKYYKEYQNVYFVTLASLFIKLKNIINYPPKKQKKKNYYTYTLFHDMLFDHSRDTRNLFIQKFE